MDDLLSRQDAIDALDSIGSLDTDADREYAREVFEALPSAQPEERTEERTETRACDCISRQMAIDAINSMFALTPTQMDMKEDCLEIIENLPSAHPEIIRCKDCEYGRDDIFDRGLWCELHPSFDPPSDDWFCGSAERRTDD